MKKKELEPKNYLFPMPTVLVGATVDGKPNFLTVAYCGIVNITPPTISVALNKAHYTNQGVRANGTFSVNIPSAAMAEATDYCGLHSGNQVDKSRVFEVFYGKLKTAPLIKTAPVNLECKLLHTLFLDPDELFIGEIVAAYANDDCLHDDSLEIKKIDPLIFSTSDKSYYRVGEKLGKAWSIGKNFKP